MGQANQSLCTGPNPEDEDKTEALLDEKEKAKKQLEAADELERQQFYKDGPTVLYIQEIDILDYETRVKRYADKSMDGLVKESQLKAGFTDLKTFDQLSDKTTVLHKLLYSPFVSKAYASQRTSVVQTTKKPGSAYDTPHSTQSHYFSIGTPRNTTHEISINSLLLLGILRCAGSYKSKAEVFSRVVQPEGQSRIQIVDRDIMTAIYFLTSMATILQEMQNNWVVNEDQRSLPIEDTDFESYERKMFEYGLVFEQVLEEFKFDIFGEYANSCSIEEWQYRLSTCGWKYFDKKNLNELFFTKMEVLYKADLFDRMPKGYQLPDPEEREIDSPRSVASYNKFDVDHFEPLTAGKPTKKGKSFKIDNMDDSADF